MILCSYISSTNCLLSDRFMEQIVDGRHEKSQISLLDLLIFNAYYDVTKEVSDGTAKRTRTQNTDLYEE